MVASCVILFRQLAVLFCGFATCGVIAQAMDPIPEVKTNYGAVYHKVKILSINGDDVAISYDGGATNIPASSFNLETLARAQIEIEANAEQKKKLEQKIADQEEKVVQQKQEQADKAQPPAQPPATDQKAPVKVAIPTLMKPPARPPAVSREQQILKLKASFPLKSTLGVSVSIVDKATKDQGVLRAHGDIVNVDIPPIDVWNWYHGMFQTTTTAALPRTLEMVDKKFAEDLAAFPAIGGGTSARVQAEQSARWFNQVLRPYIEQWRALARE